MAPQDVALIALRLDANEMTNMRLARHRSGIRGLIAIAIAVTITAMVVFHQTLPSPPL